MVTDARLALLQACQPKSSRWLKALTRAGSPRALKRCSRAELLACGLKRDEIHRYHSPDTRTISSWQRWLDDPRHGLVVFADDDYPKALAELPDPPLALWFNGGNPTLLNTPMLAIVGSRNPTGGGQRTAEAFATHLSQCGLTIVSGLATGIDSASHRGALGGIGSTVAILGCGIDVIYPRSNSRLAQDIAAHGLVVSEYPPGTPARPHRFPERNRIIAGLSLGTLVVEATRRSGSLITARLAAEYGREVFAIPGSIHNPLTRGCHRLIHNGAKLVEQTNDILSEIAVPLQTSLLPPSPTDEQAGDPSMGDPCCTKLLDLLAYEALAIGEIVGKLGLTTAELSSMLLHLELGGFVEALPGGRYSRISKRYR